MPPDDACERTCGGSAKRESFVPVYRDARAAILDRVSDLLGRMTREEKIGQLGQVTMTDFETKKDDYIEHVRAGTWGSRILAESAWAGNNAESALDVKQLNHIQRVAVEESRLGIPLLYGRDVIYGHRTVCPIPHSQAASFNPELVEKAMAAVAAEAASQGVHWTFSPMLDLVRDPRWGRVIESYGEDPLLISEMGKAAIRGFQGDDPAQPDKLLACAKHFVGYGGSEGGRDYDTAEWSDNTLHNMILPPFREAVTAGVATVMSGFNDLGGCPVSSSRTLIRDWLKAGLGWDGFVVSDWGSIYDLIGHRVAENEREAARLAFAAGVDMEMTAGFYERQIGGLIDDGTIPEAWLNDAVRRILLAKFRAGLFDRPYTDQDLASKTLRHPDHVALAADLATQSIVLLKNENKTLPIPASWKTIAVLGPYADARREHLGSWCLDGIPSEVTTIHEALCRACSHAEFVTCNAAFADACIDTARKADATILCLGESHLRNGENKSIVELALPPGQETLIEAIARFGKPLIVVDCSGRYLPIPAAQRHAHAWLHAGTLGTEAGTAIARILLGNASPSGKLPMTIPRSTGQIPVYYNRKTPGKAVCQYVHYRGYEDDVMTPLFPFGFGGSYTRFEFSNPTISSSVLHPGECVMAKISLHNAGEHEAAEVLQLYIQDCVSSTTRPERELKAFRRIQLAPGEKQTVSFEITPELLAFSHADQAWKPEPGLFRIGIGNDSTCPLDNELTFQLS